MDCREVQSLIVPFVKSELTLEEAKDVLEHIDHCPDCKEELEVYYILLIGLQELDEDTTGSLDLHGQFEEHLRRTRAEIDNTKFWRAPKMVLLLALIAVVLVLVTHEQEWIVEKDIFEKNKYEQVLPTYNPGNAILMKIQNRQSRDNVLIDKKKINKKKQSSLKGQNGEQDEKEISDN